MMDGLSSRAPRAVGSSLAVRTEPLMTDQRMQQDDIYLRQGYQ